MTERRPVEQRRTKFYPMIRTNRIFVTQTENSSLRIRIDYSLNLIRPGNDTREDGRDVLAEFVRDNSSSINISFMVLDNRNSSLIPRLFNYETLVETMMNHLTAPELAAPFQILNETNGWQRVLLRDAILQNADRQLYTTVTDMGGETNYETHNYIEFDYQVPGLLENNPTQSIFYPPNQEGDVDFSSSFLSTLELVAFLEMPYEDFANSENVPPELMSIPLTEIVYDRILQATSSNALRPPRTRKIFFINDDSIDYSNINGRAYSGPAHYEANPEQENAWYAGPDANNRGPKLSVRSVPNTKVRVDASPLPTYGEEITLGQFISGETGDDLINFIRGTNEGAVLLSPDSIVNNLVSKSVSSLSRKRKSFIEPWSYQHKWINAIDDGQELRSSYNCIFGIKMYELIKNNTLFGGLFDLHFSAIFQQQSPISLELIDKIYKKSKILSLKVIRRRLSYDPYNNNDQDSKTYVDFQENQKNRIIVETSDDLESNQSPLQLGILTAETKMASLEEVHLSLDPSENPEETIVEQTQQEISDGFFAYDVEKLVTRSFLIRDYELFYNLDCGKYTYDVEIFIKDGFREIIQERVRRLERDLLATRQVVSELASPIFRNNTFQIDFENRIQGYYDFYTNRFFNVPENLVTSLNTNLRKLIKQINSCTFLVSRRIPFAGTPDDPESEFSNILNKLDPRNQATTLHDLEFFLDKSQNLLQIMDSLLKRAYATRKFVTSPFDLRRARELEQKGSDVGVSRISARTGIIHDASDTLKLQSDFGLNDSLGLSGFLERARREALLAREFGELETTTLEEEPIDADIEDPTVDPPPGGPRPDRQPGFNPNYLEPIKFFTNEQLMLEIDPKIDLMNNFSEDIFREPFINPVRREAKAPIMETIEFQLNEPFSTNTKAINIDKVNFMKSNTIQKSVMEMKVLTMATAESHLSSYAYKDSSFDARHLASSLGQVDVKFGGKLIGEIDTTIGKYALNFLGSETSYLSKGTREAIVDELITSTSKDDFEKRISDNYDQLSETRENLGQVYEFFNRLVALENFSVKSNVFKKDSELNYKFGEPEKKQLFVDLEKNPFQKKKAQFVTITKDGGKVRHTSGVKKKMEIFVQPKANAQTGRIREVQLFKVEPIEGGDNIADVNNAILLEKIR